jgi:hypothetical protein
LDKLSTHYYPYSTGKINFRKSIAEEHFVQNHTFSEQPVRLISAFYAYATSFFLFYELFPKVEF